jgi:hypothetical protein
MKCEHCKHELKESEKVFDYTIGAYLCDYCLELLVLTDCVPTCPSCGCGVGLARELANCASCVHDSKLVVKK